MTICINIRKFAIIEKPRNAGLFAVNMTCYYCCCIMLSTLERTLGSC